MSVTLTPCSADVTVIQGLSDRPNENDNLTSSQLKAKFDKAGSDIKTYLNSTLINQVESAFSDVDTAMTTLDSNLSGKIGTLSNLNTTSKTNLVSAVNEVNTKLDDTGWQNLTPVYGTWNYLRYRKVGKKVRVEGGCPSYKFTGTNTKAIAIIPSGYRPPQNYYLMASGSGRRIVRYAFGTDGRIVIDYAVSLINGDYLSDTEWTEFSYEYYID